MCPSWLVPEIEFSDSDEPTPGLGVEAKLSIQAGSFVNLRFKIVRGKKDTPHYLRPTWYEQKMSLASNWNVLFSDTGSRRHWLLDGASAIVILSKACLRLPYAYSAVMENMWHSESASGSNKALELLQHRGNRSTLISSPTAPSENSVVDDNTRPTFTFQDLLLQLWDTLELINYDCQMPTNSETIDMQLRSRLLRGYEFKDMIEGGGILQSRMIKLQDSARDWYPLLQQVGTINIFGSGFGELIKSQPFAMQHLTPCNLTKGVPWHCDYLAIPMPVLRTIVRKYRKHTKRSVHLAKDMYWTDPERSFERCTCHDKSTSPCNVIITNLHGQAKPYPGECTSQHHSIFTQFPNGAVILGNSPAKLIKHRGSSDASPTSTPLDQVQSSDSGIDMTSQGSYGGQGSSSAGQVSSSPGQGTSSAGTASATSPTSSDRRSRLSMWLRRHISGQT